MGKNGLRSISNQYFMRFGAPLPLLVKPILPGTKIIITIPCHNEPDLEKTLESLKHCHLPECNVEVIVFINAGESDSLDIISSNNETFEETKNWISNQSHPGLEFHVLKDNNLTQKHAGVGLARKMAMDLALQRMTSIEIDGAILCLDADCTVKPNYLLALEKHFVTHQCDIATIDFDHRPEKVTNLKLKEGIIAYELFLRYYIAGLRFAGFPYAHHTIGSSMGIRASRYALSGGMNRRKAGEDFYFLHKVFPHGKVHNIQETSVYPSPRTSDRVPFGTGRAMTRWLEEGKKQLAYDPGIFVSLGAFLKIINGLYQCTEEEYHQTIRNLPNETQEFLIEQSFQSIWKELNEKTTSITNFTKRFFQWCNGFMVLKYVHFVRDRFLPSIPVNQACVQLNECMGGDLTNNPTQERLLIWFKQLEFESDNTQTQPNGYSHYHKTNQ